MQNETVKQFVDKLIEVLCYENERRIGRDRPLLNTAFLVAAVEQNLANPEFAEFIQFLKAGSYTVDYVPEKLDGKDFAFSATVQIYNGGSEYYTLMLTSEGRMWGFCECEPGQEGYDPKHRCCGKSCDWYAPAFVLEKHRKMGSASWQGLERDYWAYEEAFNKRLTERNAALAREKRAREVACLRSEIAYLQQRLRDLGEDV